MQAVLLGVIERECHVSTAGKRLDMLMNSGNNAVAHCAQRADQIARKTAQLARRNAADQLRSMEDVIRAMGIADGIKHLIVITGGIAVTHNVVDFVPVAKAASNAGVQLTSQLTG